MQRTKYRGDLYWKMKISKAEYRFLTGIEVVIYFVAIHVQIHALACIVKGENTVIIGNSVVSVLDMDFIDLLITLKYNWLITTVC